MVPPPRWRPPWERGHWIHYTRRAQRIPPSTKVVRETYEVARDLPSVDCAHREIRGAIIPRARRQPQSEAKTASSRVLGHVRDIPPACSPRLRLAATASS